MSNLKKLLKYNAKIKDIIRTNFQIGGELKFMDKEGTDNLSKYYADNLEIFFKLLKKCDKNDLEMIIGYDVMSVEDMARNLSFDIALTLYNDDIKKFMNDIPESEIKTFVLNLDFNDHNSFIVSYIGKKSMTELQKSKFAESLNNFTKINKIKNIVFDSSTFKFITNICIIALLYYLTLQQNGSIYIESNETKYQIYEIGALIGTLDNDPCFRYPTGYRIHREHGYSRYVKSDDEIYSSNCEYLRNKLLGSSVEILNSGDVPYPIENPINPITKYYKITKIQEHDLIINSLRENDDIINKLKFGFKMCPVMELKS